ncbi:MAG: hypothetical protein CVV44_17470 [Spirochaetae bacterium HGW-Spirochaetae-1]|nr:MAG: hypothetical protein CVV44_17470 [Spirochaetae bacterium HGW-Spirochaetae-1]
MCSLNRFLVAEFPMYQNISNRNYCFPFGKEILLIIKTFILLMNAGHISINKIWFIYEDMLRSRS